jgi:hypothetical protein
MPASTEPGPDTRSSDYEAMEPFWTMVETILGGAASMRQAGGGGSNPNPYLPRFPNETLADYQYRRDNAKFTNIYAEIASSLASKPFAEEVQVAADAGDQFKALAEDIDGRGNNLHVFAGEVFYHGINSAIDWVLVDYTKARPRQDGRVLSIAEERRQGLRPYWVRVPAKRMLAVYTDTVRGQEVIIHARIWETLKQRVGFIETSVERIRVFDRAPVYEALADGTMSDRVIDYLPATFEVYEQRLVSSARGEASQWQSVEAGPVTIGVIPLVPFITGRRIENTWQFVPPLQDAAHLQIEHFQQETALKSIKELTAFPMLAGNGVAPMTENGQVAQVPVGPRSVLYAPPNGDAAQHGEWTFIEPSSESLRFLASDVEATEKQLRELGRQPLIEGQVTVYQAGMNAQKANSAVQAWALALKDALEQAFVLTAAWLNLGSADAPEVRVFTDFEVGMDDDKGLDTLSLARKNGDISRETYWEELRRRNVLSADFEPDQEHDRLLQETPDPDTAGDIAGAMTPPAQQAAA